MMTKKDYIRAAEICRDEYGSDSNVAHAFADLFAEDNPRFDEERFFEACRPAGFERSRSRARR